MQFSFKLGSISTFSFFYDPHYELSYTITKERLILIPKISECCFIIIILNVKVREVASSNPSRTNTEDQALNN